jgi:hypothetical protein
VDQYDDYIPITIKMNDVIMDMDGKDDGDMFKYKNVKKV